MPRCCAIERSPLWPARPPPLRACSRPRSRSPSSCTTSTASGSTLKNFAAAATERPDSFMYVSGFSSATRWPSSRSSASLPLNFARHDAPCRRASSSTTIQPTLCLVRAYSRPGLPSPTTSRSSDEARSPRRQGKTHLPSVVPDSPSARRARRFALGCALRCFALGDALELALLALDELFLGLLDARRHRRASRARSRDRRGTSRPRARRDRRGEACRPSPSR